MPCVLSCCSNKGGYAGNWNCGSWLCLSCVFKLTCRTSQVRNFFFFASFSVKRKQVCVRIQSVLSSFPKAFRCFDAFLEPVSKG